MLKSARSRYVLAAALWVAAVGWVAFGPRVMGVPTLLVGLALAATIMAAVLERDERVQQIVRLSWWACAGVRADEGVPLQRRGSVASWPGVRDRVS